MKIRSTNTWIALASVISAGSLFLTFGIIAGEPGQPLSYVAAIVTLYGFFFFFKTIFYQIEFDTGDQKVKFRGLLGTKSLTLKNLQEWGIRRMSSFGGYGTKSSQQFFVGKLNDGSIFLYPLVLGEYGMTAKTIEMLSSTFGKGPVDYGKGGVLDDIKRYGLQVLYK